MQGEISKDGKKVKEKKDGQYIDRCCVKIWSKINKWFNVAQEIK